MAESLFSSQRSRLLKGYKEANQAVVCATQPYHSTAVFKGEVVDADSTFAPGVAFLKFAKNQVLSFFNYGLGDNVQLGGSAGASVATDAETNLGKAASTNGAMDFVIEGIGFHTRGQRVQYATTGVPVSQVADPAVIAAVTGNGPIYDPAAILMPPQVQSPFNLEQGVFQSLLGISSLELTFDRQRIFPLGTVDLLPQAGGQSMLRANGLPTNDNRYRIPEGYLWRKDGMTDSDLLVTVTLQRDLIVPINRITNFHDTEGTSNFAPQFVWVECVLRLFGLGVNMPSAN